MKKAGKKILAALAAILVLAAGWYCITVKHVQTILISSSLDGMYAIRIEQIGDPDFPYGNTHCRILLQQDNEILDQTDADLANDGVNASAELFEVVWQEDGASVTVSACEQEPVIYELKIRKDR